MPIEEKADGNTAWGNDYRALVRRRNELTDESDTANPQRIPVAALGTGTPTGAKFLRDDRTWASATKLMEDTFRAVWAKSPSAESGLTALAVDASTNDASRIQTMLNYLSTTYGRGARLFVPPGTSNVNSGITLPAGVQIVGVPGESRWDYWFAGTGTFTALTINDTDFVPITGLEINGQQWDANAATANVTTNTALNITGHALGFEDVSITGFNRGINISNDNTFILTFERISIVNCMTGLFADLDGTYGGTARSNSGESIQLNSCVLANCGTALIGSGNGLGLFLSGGTSIDFCNIFGKFSNAHVMITGCHLETTYMATPSTMGSDGNPARYLFDLDGNPRVTFANCLFIMGSTGVYSVINPLKGPFNYGVGYVQFEGCNGTTGMHGSVPAGTLQGGFSKVPVSFAVGDTTKTVASLFLSKWNLIAATTAFMDGGAQQNLTARVTAANMTQGYITVTLSAAAPSGGAWVLVDF